MSEVTKPSSARDRVPPCSANIRFRVDPADVPAEKAARRLHLTLAEFQQKLPELLARGFPPPDPTTDMFDLDAIDAWRASRHAIAGDIARGEVSQTAGGRREPQQGQEEEACARAARGSTWLTLTATFRTRRRLPT